MTKHFDTDFKAPDTRPCRVIQDERITTLETCIENLERRVFALEVIKAQIEGFFDRQAVGHHHGPIGAVIWDTGAVTWGECYTPPFVHSPGYPAPEEAT